LKWVKSIKSVKKTWPFSRALLEQIALVH
jgi:hypothetical protein